ncbi:hypothetical protein BA6E_10820 [Bacteroidales bacterium 6E]|nr:hypothetical protein BA6E_10820 [Bacteroidales bacterium 6E]
MIDFMLYLTRYKGNLGRRSYVIHLINLEAAYLMNAI